MTQGDLQLIKGQLQERIAELCRRLLPHGRDEAGQWVSFNPVTGDQGKHHNPALKVRMRGGVAGAWKCYRSGDAGDVIDLVAYIERTDRAGALAWSRDFLGLKTMSREERMRLTKVTLERKEKQLRADDAARRRKIANAEQLFRAGGDVGTVACPQGTFSLDKGAWRHAAQLHAEAYFAAREVPLSEIPTLNTESLRFSPQTEWWKGATWAHDAAGRRFKTAHGQLYPAVHSAMRNALGIVTACHCTFLDVSRPAKAPVDPPKLMAGEAKGSIIELSTGPSGVPFWRWTPELPAHPVILAEGIETALAFAVAGTPGRVWAVGSLSGFAHAPIQLPCVSWVLVAADNNHGNPQAQRQLARAVAALEAHGKPVTVQRSHVGDDFNDLQTGKEK